MVKKEFLVVGAIIVLSAVASFVLVLTLPELPSRYEQTTITQEVEHA